MLLKVWLSLVVCFLVCALLSASIVSAKEDPELKQCRHQCRAQQQMEEGKIRICLEDCEEYHREKQERERERRHEGGGGGGGGGRDVNIDYHHGDPDKEYRKCREQCQSEQEGQQKCLRRCEKGKRSRGGDNRSSYEEQGRHGGKNPYVFQDEHFSTPFKTEHGRIRVLQRFGDTSELLRLTLADYYRLLVLEADPQTFIVPNHLDAKAVFFVAQGRGTLSMIGSENQKRESFYIKRGDIVRVPAGTTIYLINGDNNEKLVIAKFLLPVSTPSQFESFFGAGGQNPESFYRAFSTDILEAAFNTKGDRLERLFGQQRQGVIIKASEEQIRAMSQHEKGGIWPFGGETKGTINIFQQRPSQSNQYGQLYVVKPDDFKDQEELDVAVSYFNISQNAMAGPLYSSKATKIAVVLNGDGYFEMACPHLSSSQNKGSGEGGSPSYEKVSAQLRRGTVVVIPASHPFVTVASNNQNLEFVCFEVNAKDSWKFTLAGKRSVVSQLEEEAKELAFGMPAREVEEIFGNQEQEFFFRGPRSHQQQHEGRADE